MFYKVAPLTRSKQIEVVKVGTQLSLPVVQEHTIRLEVKADVANQPRAFISLALDISLKLKF